MNGKNHPDTFFGDAAPGSALSQALVSVTLCVATLVGIGYAQFLLTGRVSILGSIVAWSVFWWRMERVRAGWGALRPVVGLAATGLAWFAAFNSVDVIWILIAWGIVDGLVGKKVSG